MNDKLSYSIGWKSIIFSAFTGIQCSELSW